MKAAAPTTEAAQPKPKNTRVLALQGRENIGGGVGGKRFKAPDHHHKGNNRLLEEALQLQAAGFGVIVVGEDKKPRGGRWKAAMHRMLTRQELGRGIRDGGTGLAVVGGEASDGLIVIDFDADKLGRAVKPLDLEAEFHSPWRAAIAPFIDPDTLPCQRTPNGGWQYYLRCPKAPGNLKIAGVAAWKVLDRQVLIGTPGTSHTAIETRAEGGYAVIPTDGSGREWLNLSLLETPTATQEMADQIVQAARALDQVPHERAPAPKTQQRNRAVSRTGESPIEAYNRERTVEELLEDHGYEYDARTKRYLSPDSTSKNAGVTILLDGRCFSHHSNDALADGKAHDPFDLYVILEHGGDANAAMTAWIDELRARRGMNARTSPSLRPTTAAQDSTKTSAATGAELGGGEVSAPADPVAPLPALDAPTAKTRLVYLGCDEMLMRHVQAAFRGNRQRVAFVAAPDVSATFEELREMHPKARCILVAPAAADSETHRLGLNHNIQVATMRGDSLTPPRNANPRLAFADIDPDATFKRKVALAEQFGLTVREHAPGAGLTVLEPGVHVLAQGMAGFKSQTIGATVKARVAAGGKALTVTHYRSLAGNLTLTCDAVHYDDIDQRRVADVNNAVYVINSGYKRLHKGRLVPAETYGCDEWGQVLTRFTSTSDFANKVECWEAHNEYARLAETLMLADANPSEAHLTYLRAVRGDEPMTMHVSRTRGGLGRRIQPYAQRGGVRRSLCHALRRGENGWLAVDSVRQARRLAAWFRKEFPDLSILLVCRDTTGEPEVEQFFRDPNAASAEYRLVIASPTISTGVSIENDHFSWVGGEFGAQVRTPTDAWQALSRVRGAPLLHVWVNQARRRKLSDAAALWVQFFDHLGDNQSMCGLADGSAAVRDPLYEQLYVNVKRLEIEANNRYSYLFWEQAAEDGWTILEECDADTADAVAVVREADTLEQAEHEARLLNYTPDKTPGEIADLIAETESRAPTVEEQYIMDRHDIKRMRCLPDEPDPEEMAAAIAGDGRGEWRAQQRRLELAVRVKDHAFDLEIRDLRRAGGTVFAINKVDRVLERDLYRRYLVARGIDPDTLEPVTDGFCDPNGERIAEFAAWAAQDHIRLRSFAGVPDDMEGIKPGLVMRSMDKALGLKQHRRKRDGRWQYQLDLEVLAECREIFIKRGVLPPSRTHSTVKEEQNPVCVPRVSVPPVRLDTSNSIVNLNDDHQDRAVWLYHRDRLGAFREWVAVLPGAERAPIAERYEAHLIDGRHIALATPNDLDAETAAFRSCAQDWLVGRRSVPADHLTALPTVHHSSGVLSAHGVAR
jgi:hypothetical protein